MIQTFTDFCYLRTQLIKIVKKDFSKKQQTLKDFLQTLIKQL